MKTPTKPTMMEVRQAHHLTSRQIADQAEVPLRVAYLLEIGGVVRKAEACKVLDALSSLTGESYTLESFEAMTRQEYVQTIVPHTPVGNQCVRH